MKKFFTAGALMCIAGHSYAQFSEAQLDSIVNAVQLQEVEVKGVSRMTRADRQVVIPPHSVVESSVNGRDLIGRLHLPRISVNPLTGEIGLSGNGTVVITINGVMGSSAELAAIAPGDIVRIEHIDNPGPRYPDADVVLNVVTRRHDTGGSVSADFLNAFRKGGEADLDHLSLSYSHGKSQWVYSGQLMRLVRDNWTRDYSEIRHFPAQTMTIKEIGLPSEMEISDFNNSLSYSLADDNRYMFNAKVGFLYDAIPHSEEADRTTLRTISTDNSVSEIYEHLGERSVSPSLDLYGQYRFGSGATLIANVVGTYIRSKNDHIYRQTDTDGNLLESISSHNKGRKYSIISELAYNQQFNRHRISGGIRHFQSIADNRYAGDVVSAVTLRQAQTTVYGQYSVTLGRVNLMASAGAARFYSSQANGSLSRWIFTPSLAASWSPVEELAFRYKVALQGKMPSLSELSDIAQPIDPGYLRKGNPDLKAFRILDQEFSAGWQWRWLSIDLSVPITHEFKPIMESVVWMDEAFVRTYFNQRSFSHIGAEARISVRPWKDYVVVSLTPTIDHYRSHGNDFRCSHTIRNLQIDAEINWKNWQLSYNTLTGYANYLYGTRLMRERNMSMVMAGYRSDVFSLKAGVLDPFVKKYWMETRDESPLLSSVSRAYSRRPTYFVVQLSVNLGFGRQKGSRDPGLDNSDTDGGLLKGVK